MLADTCALPPANLHIPDFSDDITPTGSKPQMRLSPAMVSRSRSATPTALTIGTSSSESDGSNSSSTTGSASTAPPTSASGSTRTSRRAMATASLKRIFRQTFQSPKGGRSGSSTVSSRSPSRSPGRNLGEALERMHGGFLPEIPRVDTVFLKDFDEVGAGTGSEWEERQVAGSLKSRDAKVRRVSTLGVTVCWTLAESRAKIVADGLVVCRSAADLSVDPGPRSASGSTEALRNVLPPRTR